MTDYKEAYEQALEQLDLELAANEKLSRRIKELERLEIERAECCIENERLAKERLERIKELETRLELAERKAAALDWLDACALADTPQDIHIYYGYPLPRHDDPGVCVVNTYGSDQGEGPNLVEAIEAAMEKEK